MKRVRYHRGFKKVENEHERKPLQSYFVYFPVASRPSEKTGTIMKREI